MAQARAAEVGRWVLRATSSGISQIINPSGQVVASIPCNESGSVDGMAVPLKHRTIYMRGPYLLPIICLVIGGLWVLWLMGTGFAAWKRRRRSAEATAQSPDAGQ